MATTPPRPLSVASYWDFASMFRNAFTTWNKPCSGGLPCWHQQNNSSILHLAKLSYGEIRTKVMLTIGTKLPPELTEMVFQAAMDEEDVNVENTLYWTGRIKQPGDTVGVCHYEINALVKASLQRTLDSEPINWLGRTVDHIIKGRFRAMRNCPHSLFVDGEGVVY